MSTESDLRSTISQLKAPGVRDESKVLMEALELLAKAIDRLDKRVTAIERAHRR